MGKPTGFLEYDRLVAHDRPVAERVCDFREIPTDPLEDALRREGARCMDCGIPFCHSLGCPVSNFIPEWNDAVYRGQWKEAWERLELTNGLPEITGRVCPAPCEAACTLAIDGSAVSIKKLERAVSERAFQEGWVVPKPPSVETGKRIAVVGSGPAGLSAAQMLRRMGHHVTVFEKSENVGGLLRYGIPDFKLEKSVLDRRIEHMSAEGVEFETEVVIGEDLSARYIRKRFDVVLLTMGAGQPRDLPVPGRELAGIHYAMQFLTQSNRVVAGGNLLPGEDAVSAAGKRVLVIGGGDTGSDCVGTSIRQGARSVVQIEILPRPPEWVERRNPAWPYWPNVLRTSTSQEEGCEREWAVATKRFVGGGHGGVRRAECVRVEWAAGRRGGRPELKEVPGSDFSIETDLVLLAAGFVHVEHSRLVDDLGVDLDDRGNILVDADYRTSVDGVFAAGDAAVGASLVVRAIDHGRRAARSIDERI